jgi:hypothetical protein
VAWGSGYGLDDGNGVVALTRMAVDGGLHNTVTVKAREAAPGQTTNWALHAYAFCGVQPAGFEVVNSPGITAYPSENEFGACSAGNVLISPGFRLQDDDGEVSVYKQATLEYPGGSGQWSSATSARELTSGTPDDWNLVSQAVCAAP